LVSRPRFLCFAINSEKAAVNLLDGYIIRFAPRKLKNHATALICLLSEGVLILWY